MGCCLERNGAGLESITPLSWAPMRFLRCRPCTFSRRSWPCRHLQDVLVWPQCFIGSLLFQDGVSGEIPATVPYTPLHKRRTLVVITWLARDDRFLLSRQLHRSHQCFYCRFTVCHKHGPLQTPRLQALDDDLGLGFRGSFLFDRGCLCHSRLFFSKREHHQHVVTQPERRAVQPNSRVMISLFSRIL